MKRGSSIFPNDFLSSVNRSSWCPWPTLARSEPTRMASAGGQLRVLNGLQSGSPRDLAIGIDASEINGPVWSVSDRGTTGAFRLGCVLINA
jgi:hypothetical protein